jgi:hypothetical protein
MLSSLLARRAWPPDSRRSRAAAAGIGLANLGTLLGLAAAYLVAGSRIGCPWRRALRAALATSLLFCGLLLLLGVASVVLG